MATKFSMYDDNDKIIWANRAERIDISMEITIIYLKSAPEAVNKNTIRWPFHLASICIERGTVTAYYCNGQYLIITNG
jgi:hypothetical protein